MTNLDITGRAVPDEVPPGAGQRVFFTRRQRAGLRPPAASAATWNLRMLLPARINSR
jgi:hypothetical protein